MSKREKRKKKTLGVVCFSLSKMVESVFGTVEKSHRSHADSYVKCFHLFHRSICLVLKREKKIVLTKEGGGSWDVFPHAKSACNIKARFTALQQASKATRSTVCPNKENSSWNMPLEMFADVGKKAVLHAESGNKTKHYRGP